MLCAKITLHAGYTYEGEVYFRAEHPITKNFCESHRIKHIQDFCNLNNLFCDRSLLGDFLHDLELDQTQARWRIKEKHLDKSAIVSSALAYVKLIQKDLF